MKIHQRLFESELLNEEWPREFQTLSREAQEHTRYVLLSRRVDIKNSTVTIHDPSDLALQPEILNNKDLIFIFFLQKKNEETGFPDPIQCNVGFSRKDGSTIQKGLSVGATYYSFQGEEIPPSGKQRNWSYNSREYLEFLKTDKDFQKTFRFIAVVNPISAVETQDSREKNRELKSKSNIRTQLYYNPSSKRYTHDRWTSDMIGLDKSGYNAYEAGERLRKKLARIRKKPKATKVS